ncbi:MAG: hypothetical protein ABIH11_05950 [Candidatus Altiarchaeota archaeon]
MSQRTGEPPARVVDFVDLGHEDAFRLKELASRPRHASKVFIGIDRPGMRGGVESGLDNLELRWGGALRELAGIPGGSVRIVNADFLFSEFYFVGWRDMFPLGQSDEVSLWDLGWKANTGVMQGLFDDAKTRVIGEVGRILVPKGRFYATEYRENYEHTLRRLDEEGFTHVHRDLRAGEMGGTRFLQKIREMVDSGQVDAERYWPVRIMARREGRV